MKSMKSHDERIRKMFEKAGELSENQVAVAESGKVDDDVKAFSANWEKLYTMWVFIYFRHTRVYSVFPFV